MNLTRRSMFFTPLAALAGEMFGGRALHHSGPPLLSWDAAKLPSPRYTVEICHKVYSISLVKAGGVPYQEAVFRKVKN